MFRQVKLDGHIIGEYESHPGSTSTSLGIKQDGVKTVTLESIDISSEEWISLLEVGWMGDRCRLRQHQCMYRMPSAASMVDDKLSLARSVCKPMYATFLFWGATFNVRPACDHSLISRASDRRDSAIEA